MCVCIVYLSEHSALIEAHEADFNTYKSTPPLSSLFKYT